MMLISLFKTLFKTLFPLCLLVVTPTILSTMGDASAMVHQHSSITEAFNVFLPIPDSSAPMVTGNLTGSAINLGRMDDELIIEITSTTGCTVPVFSLDYILEITNQEDLIKSSTQDESFFVFLKRFICVSLDYILELANQEPAKFSTKEGDESFLLPELPRQSIYFTLGSLVVIGCCAIVLAKILSALKNELQLYPPTMCGGQHCSIQRPFKVFLASDEPVKKVRTEQKTKPTGRFVGPSFLDYRQPEAEYDDEEASVASAPGATTAIMNLNKSIMISIKEKKKEDDLLNAISKLPLKDNTPKTASDDFESSMAELVNAFAKL